MSNKILITGGTGLLGSELSCHFSKENDIYRMGSSDFDICEKKQVFDIFDKIQPDIVLHSAAISDVDFCERNKGAAMMINADGAENVALGCKERNITLVYYSTDYVFDGEKGMPYSEDDKPAPINYYGVTKLEGENRVAAILDNYLILRIAWLFANHKKAFVNKTIDKGRKQIDLKKQGVLCEPEKIVDDQIGTPTYAYDVARQTKAILDKGLTGLYHCVSEGATSRYNLAKYVYEYLSMPVDILPCSASEYEWIAPRPRYTALANTRLTKESINIMPHYKKAVTNYLKEFIE